MTSGSKEPKDQQGFPGDRIKKLAKRNRVLRAIFSHSHVLQIVDDHQAMWFEAANDAEKRRIEQRLRRELTRASVNFIGLEVALHGAVTTVLTDPLHGGSMIVVGAVVMYVTGGKG